MIICEEVGTNLYKNPAATVYFGMFFVTVYFLRLYIIFS